MNEHVIRFRFGWRSGWAWDRLRRCRPEVRARRERAIQAAVEKACGGARLAGSVSCVVQVDLTKRATRRVHMGELIGLVAPLRRALGYEFDAVAFKPSQYALPGWGGSKGELLARERSTRRLAARYRRRGRGKLADGLLSGLGMLRPQVYVTLTTEVVGIAGGLDGGDSTWQTVSRVGELVPVRDGCWASVLVVDDSPVSQSVFRARVLVDQMVAQGKIRGWDGLLQLVVRYEPSSEQIVVRDWGPE